MISKHHQGVLVALTEQKSRHILSVRLPAKHAEGVTERIINNLLPPHQHRCHTVIYLTS
ncbi:hypothetical protein [Nitrosomonas communis]|uniref:hypothetical protein n=1 Tax=Nitrosomonas communis TaxID=44574 RepID=UPI0015A67DA9|nr:hypothetical protein [Nitrosomonas communis]